MILFVYMHTIYYKSEKVKRDYITHQRYVFRLNELNWRLHYDLNYKNLHMPQNYIQIENIYYLMTPLQLIKKNN